MADSLDAALKGAGVGSPAPAQQGNAVSKGTAAPASQGKPAGSPSTPDLDAAIVAEKRKAEHWQHKHERDVGALTERLAKLEGLADGLSAGKAPPANKNPQSWSD